MGMLSLTLICTYLVVHDAVADLVQVALGEDETDVSLDVGEESLQVWVVFQVATDGFAHHGVLSHEHHS